MAVAIDGGLITPVIRKAETKGLSATWNERAMWNRMRMSETDISDVTAATYHYLINGHDSATNWTGFEVFDLRGGTGTNLDIDKWGTGDLIYVDDQSNNLAKINHKSSSAITPGSSSSSGLVALQTIRFDQAAGVANPGYINIISTETPGGSLTESALLNQLHIANTRYGKEVSLRRTDSVSADPLMVGSNITSLTPAVFEVSTTGLRVGDVIKLVFVDNNGVTTALTTPISYTVISGDVTAGKASVSVGDLSGLTSGTTYTMAAQLTDRDGAVSLSTPVSLSYVSSVTTPTLSLGSASNDLTLDPSENDIELFVSGSTLNVGDKVAIQLAGSTITTTTSATSTPSSLTRPSATKPCPTPKKRPWPAR